MFNFRGPRLALSFCSLQALPVLYYGKCLIFRGYIELWQMVKYIAYCILGDNILLLIFTGLIHF